MPFPTAPKNSVSLSTLPASSSKSKEEIAVEKQRNSEKWNAAINDGMEQAALLVFQVLANTTEGGSSLEKTIQEQWYECVSEFEDTESTNNKNPYPQLMRRYDFSRDSKLKLLDGSDVPNPTKFDKASGKTLEVHITLGMMLSWKDPDGGEFTRPGERLRTTMSNWLPNGKAVLIFPVRTKEKQMIPYKFDIKIVDDGNMGDTENKYDWIKYH
tara:strand:+ start:551 stop:1189 length:639 start_codon:yes stop_codon:yes gene_type:complete